MDDQLIILCLNTALWLICVFVYYRAGKARGRVEGYYQAMKTYSGKEIADFIERVSKKP